MIMIKRCGMLALWMTALLCGCQMFNSDPVFSDVCERTLDETIQTVREKHFSDAINNVNWVMIREKYAAKILASTDVQDLTKNINTMLGEVGHSHLALLEPTDPLKCARINAILDGTAVDDDTTDMLENIESDTKLTLPVFNMPNGAPGGVGMRLAQTDTMVYVSRIIPGLPAARAGIRSGDRIISVKTDKKNLSLSTKILVEKSFIPFALIAEQLLTGESGKRCVIRYRPLSGGEIKQAKLVREPNGLTWSKLGIMDMDPGYYECSLSDSGIGYIAFSPCMAPQIVCARKDIRRMTAQGMRALIVDLRGNPGGLGLMSRGIGGMLTDTPMQLFTDITRYHKNTQTAYPQKGAFLGPLAVLTDGRSGSSSELFAAAIQDNRRGKIFGTQTAGQCLGSQFIELSDGFRLQTVLSDICRINGKPIEGVGVTPDVNVTLRWHDIVNGNDTVISAAEKELMKTLNEGVQK